MWNKYKYHLSIAAAGFCYSTLSLFTALLTNQKVDAFTQIFWRCYMSFCHDFHFQTKIEIGKKGTSLYIGKRTYFDGRLYHHESHYFFGYANCKSHCFDLHISRNTGAALVYFSERQ